MRTPKTLPARASRTLVAGCAALCCFVVVTASPVAARERQRTVRASTHAALTQIQAAMEAKRYDEAMREIQELAPRVERFPFERAVLDQAKAYALMEREQYADAIPVIGAALAAGELSQQATENLRYNLAQIELAAGRPRESVRALEPLLGEVRAETSARVRALAGHAYYLLGEPARARRELEHAVASIVEPPEDWVQLLLATCYEQQAFGRAQELLRELVVRFPEKKRYWLDLSAVALHLDDGPAALAALELAKGAGLLESSDLVRLARLNVHFDAPARAARLLSAALADGEVEETARHVEFLADAWVMAREYERARVALARAASLAPERRRELALREGELLVHQERWQDAGAVLAIATESESAASAAHAQLLLGVAAYYRGDYAQSLVAFGRAEEHEATVSQAKQWTRQVAWRVSSADARSVGIFPSARSRTGSPTQSSR